MSIEIIPSILVKTREEFESRVRLVEGHFQSVQMDVCDGIFVPNTTLDGFAEVQTIAMDLKCGIHLMVSKPENHVARWLTLENVNEICFHVEATAKHLEVIKAIQDGDMSVGMVMNPKTPWKDLEPYIDLLDFVQFMTVEPGFNGAPFVPAVIEKIADFHFYYPDKPISVDGGVTPDKVDALAAAGVTRCIVGSAITKFFKNV